MTSVISDQSVVVTSAGLTAADLGGEAVVLDASTGKYYGLNEVGLRIFELAREPRQVEDIILQIVSEYDAPEAQVRDDVVTFLETMEQRALLEVRDGPVN